MNLMRQTVIKSLVATHKAPAMTQDDREFVGNDIETAFRLGYSYGKANYEVEKFQKKTKKKS